MLEITLFHKQKFKIFGIRYDLIKQFSANLCSFRKLDFYKGKGLHFDLSSIKLKASSKVK
jgi:ribosomal protein L6P/L9E